jgi:hypothetical protein
MIPTGEPLHLLGHGVQRAGDRRADQDQQAGVPPVHRVRRRAEYEHRPKRTHREDPRGPRAARAGWLEASVADAIAIGTR